MLEQTLLWPALVAHPSTFLFCAWRRAERCEPEQRSELSMRMLTPDNLQRAQSSVLELSRTTSPLAQ